MSTARCFSFTSGAAKPFGYRVYSYFGAFASGTGSSVV
jgi:hypothetical protein